MASSRAPAVSAAGPLRKMKTVPAPVSRGYRGLAMEFGIFNLMGSRDPAKLSAQTFAEVAEQTKLADELGYAIAWFAEHHFSNYCLCASPLIMVSHCAAITKHIRLGTAVLVLPLYNPARLAAEIAMADALSSGRLMLGVGAGYQPYEFERFGIDLKQNLEMTEEFCEILDLALNRGFFTYNGLLATFDDRGWGLQIGGMNLLSHLLPDRTRVR